MAIQFSTTDPRYQWLNTTLGVVVSEFDERAGRSLWRAFIPYETRYRSPTKGTSMFQRRFWMRGDGSPLVALVALFTTLCCLGFPALVGLLSALGASFLLNDRYLEPLLAGTLLLTLLIAGLHLRRHHQPGPFILSLVAAGSVFFAIYGIGLLPHASGGDHMADGMAPPPTWSPFSASGATTVLRGAQVCDVWLYGRRRPRPPPFRPSSP